MKLTPYEMETIILYNQEEAAANVYTHDPKLIAKLRRLQEKYPNRVFPDRSAQLLRRISLHSRRYRALWRKHRPKLYRKSPHRLTPVCRLRP